MKQVLSGVVSASSVVVRGVGHRSRVAWLAAAALAVSGALPFTAQAAPPAPTSAGSVPSAPTQSPPATDDGLTPRERFDKGIRTFGVFAVSDAAHCSQAAASRAMSGLLPDAQVLGRNMLGQPITAGGYTEGMRTTLQQVMDTLKASGDEVAAQRHICVGIGMFPKGPNAVSVDVGYIIGDPRITDQINALPDRTMFSLDMVWVHELAHQVQYWHGNPFKDDARVRRTELAADCVASALIAQRWKEAWALKMAADGIIAASIAVGDLEVENKQHHGTPVERKLAASRGIDYALQQLEKGGKGLTSGALLKSCNDFIEIRDRLSGPGWPDKSLYELLQFEKK